MAGHDVDIGSEACGGRLRQKKAATISRQKYRTRKTNDDPAGLVVGRV